MVYFFKSFNPFFLNGIATICLLINLSCSLEVDSDQQLIKYFDIEIKVEGQGEVSPGGGVYVNNSKIIFKATPNSGYYFDRWIGFDEDVESEQHEISLTQNLTLIAVFLPIPDLSKEILVYDPKLIDQNPIFMIENGGKSAYLTSKTGKRQRTWNFDLNLGNDLELMPDGSVIGIFKPNTVFFSFGGYGGVLKKYDPQGSLAVSYTHLTLPTNREV